ncbi:hypothetical protein BJG93_34835 (plasmid) [Paraburkholderia sprentiae WSM5005]|uniref:Uncharacterized protein n=1 Tax=Paraburkholderia sprentiae WSM5005 TaxID=754502 RepID=A0ACA8AX70_9BURK|nr:hypothetical protein [Paraburkholderia sprentiae]APA90290.1 hypothetical protein BJG93_34835 [Paraburkholderia sprentiae WSM5005]
MPPDFGHMLFVFFAVLTPVVAVFVLLFVRESKRTPKETFFLGEYEIDAQADLSDGAWVRVRKSQGDRKWGRKMVKIIGQQVTFL